MVFANSFSSRPELSGFSVIFRIQKSIKILLPFVFYGVLLSLSKQSQSYAICTEVIHYGGELLKY